MSMSIPTIPVLPAGYVVTAGDLNNLAYAAQFLLTKPIVRAYDGTGGQSLSSGGTAVSYSAVYFDTDGMWGISNPTKLYVQTPGFYSVSYMVNQNNGIIMNTAIKVTTGSNNPGGSGVTTSCWPGYGYGTGSGRVCGRASGIIPWYMYVNDYVQVYAYPASTASTSSDSTFTPSYLAMELVSI